MAGIAIKSSISQSLSITTQSAAVSVLTADVPVGAAQLLSDAVTSTAPRADARYFTKVEFFIAFLRNL
jgi:hypothetical protein